MSSEKKIEGKDKTETKQVHVCNVNVLTNYLYHKYIAVCAVCIKLKPV